MPKYSEQLPKNRGPSAGPWPTPRLGLVLTLMLFAFSQNFSREKSSSFHTCI